MIHEGYAQSATPDHGREASNCVQGSKQAHNMPGVSLLNPLVERLAAHVSHIGPVAHPLQS